jgi:hypothetical protein
LTRRGARILPLPTASHPYVILPISSRDETQTALRSYYDDRFRTRMLKIVLEAAIAIRPLRPILGARYVMMPTAPRLGADSLLGRLIPRLDSSEVFLTVRLGIDRPTRKPVLQIFDSETRRIQAYVKVGWTPLSARLVKNEADSLQSLDALASDFTIVAFPRVLTYSDDHSTPMLATEPLPVPTAVSVWHRASDRVRKSDVIRALREMANVDPKCTKPLGETVFWASLIHRIREAAHVAVEQNVDALDTARAFVASRFSDLSVQEGLTHGDWARYNMISFNGQLLVWDWERSSLSAIVGLDAAHFDLHDALRRHRRAQQAVQYVLSDDGTVLRAVERSSRRRQALLLLKLMEMCCRFEEARQPSVKTGSGSVYHKALSAALTWSETSKG